MKLSRYNHFLKLENEDAYYAFNARTLALAKLDASSFDRVNALAARQAPIVSSDLECLDSEAQKGLQEGGFLVADDTDELTELYAKFMANKHKGKGLTLTIAPTIWCNFACPYCYEGEKPKGMMTRAVQDHILAFVRHQVRTKELSAVSVAWYGGEPLLGLDAIRYLSANLMAWCAEESINYYASIVTNGSLLTRSVAEELRGYRVNQVQVTIDGPREVHDRMRPFYGKQARGSTFDLIMKNLAEVVGVLPIRLRMNIDRSNAERAIDLVMDFKERGWLEPSKDFAFYFARIHDAEFLKGSPGCNDSASSCYDAAGFAALELELHRALLERGVTVRRYPSLKLSSCGTVASNGYVIGPNGELYKCWEDAGIPDRTVGNVEQLDVDTASAAMQKWARWNPFDDEICKECNVLPTCMGGCPAHALLHGRSSGINCTSWKYELRGNIEFFLKNLAARQAQQAVPAAGCV